jgi:phospholipid/cholesterol/gamma-HCH transport system substrate-binding protein
MGQRAPTVGQIAVAVAFAFSCFGLLLFLWATFGGPVPLAPEGYRVKVPMTEGVQLAEESDVRISNVSVGKVKNIELEDEGENRDRAIATLEIDEAYAPIPEDTRVILRQKTLLGEAYIELTQGSDEAGTIPEDGTLPQAQVSDAVQLDEIFRTFDDRTKAAFQTWMQQAALSLAGRGDDLSAAIGNLEPFAEDANRLVRVLSTQDQAVSQFVNNTGVVFEALSERQGQLQGLIRNSGTVFHTTAVRNQDLREAFIALPTFLDESRLTLNRLETFAADANPLITQLRPAGRELSGVLRQTARSTPGLRSFFVGLRKISKRAPTAFPALQRLLDTDLPPLLTQLSPFLQQLSPVVKTFGRYQREVTGFLGNVAATTNAVGASAETGNAVTHYIRGAATIHPESLAVFPGTLPNNGRLRMNRSNPYLAPGGALNAPQLNFENRYCGGAPGTIANLDPTTPANPAWIPRATQVTPAELFDNLQTFAFLSNSGTGPLPAPPCTVQPLQPSIGETAVSTKYPQVYQDAP